MVGQLVTKNPSEGISRAETVIKYLRRTADLCLEYGKAPDDFGEWDQLKFRRHKGLVEAYADASLASDSLWGCPSVLGRWAGVLAVPEAAINCSVYCRSGAGGTDGSTCSKPSDAAHYPSVATRPYGTGRSGDVHRQLGSAPTVYS